MTTNPYPADKRTTAYFGLLADASKSNQAMRQVKCETPWEGAVSIESGDFCGLFSDELRRGWTTMDCSHRMKKGRKSMTIVDIGNDRGGSLWCQQGSTIYSPGQCAPSTLDCFKFICNHNETGFVARGCGVTVSRTASGLPNESCNQALGQCQAIGGYGSCHICNNLHMCNSSSLFTFLLLLPLIRFLVFL